MRAWIRVVLLTSLAGCGGVVSTISGGDGGGSDARPDGTRPDAGSCGTIGGPTGPDGCLETEPLVGSCCEVGQSICGTGDPCCVGYVWACTEENVCDIDGCHVEHWWEMEGLGCACPVEAGGPDASHDAKPDVAPHEAGLVPCGTQACPPTDICVTTESGGGPCLEPNDAGGCPGGYTREGGCCVFMSTTYACEPATGSCAGGVTCPSECATDLCKGCPCAIASDHELTCTCDAP
jgi:hypothetical protein